MLRLLKNTWWVILLAAGTQTAPAFALLGNREPYHVINLGYSGGYWDQPKNLDQEFRWSIPKVYYAYDESFISYFGTNGMKAVDAGIQIINDLPNASAITNLDEYPLYSMRANFTAQAMRLFDLKSVAVEMLVERLGLADPEQFVWTLRQRALPPGANCPNYTYAVIKRNFDPDTLMPSSYVNGNLYSYEIVDGCPDVDEAVAAEYLVDPNSIWQSAVASSKIMVGDYAYWGYYYTGLTRDDVGGLRYLYKTNNAFTSAAGPDTYTFATNYTARQLVVTSNLTTLSWQALTNPAAGLQALYPDLVILQTTNNFTNIYFTNYTAYFTNLPWDPFGTAPRIRWTTNVELAVLPIYSHTFGNLYTVTNSAGQWLPVPIYNIESFTNNQFVSVEITTVTNEPFSPFGQVKTNTIRRTYGTNIIAGDFFIMPTNSCSVNILGLQATMPYQWTNSFLSLTNASADTNNAGWTNVFLYTEQQMIWSTNRAFVVNPVVCDTNSVANRQGVDKVSFLRRDYDSTVNRYFYPITNTYFLTAITNWGTYRQTVQRFVTAPDILFDAVDLAVGTITWPILNPTVSREEPHFVTATAGGGTNLFGPGTIDPPVNFTFNKVGPLYYNYGPFFIDERSSDLDFIWASFDGSTNPPVIYPQTLNLSQYTNSLFMYVANHSIPNAKVGQAYRVQFVAGGSGGTPPYTWELAPQSPALPVGMNLTPEGVLETTAPAALQPNIYDFVVRFKDVNSLYVDTAFTLTILP